MTRALALMDHLPVINIAALVGGDFTTAEAKKTIDEIGNACEKIGFFYISGHGISDELQTQLETVGRQFFKLTPAEKAEITMEKGGKAWRGWFPTGGEMTSGRPDLKEGLYLGVELPSSDPRPLHGPNLFPRQIPAMREIILRYLEECKRVGFLLMTAISHALQIDAKIYQQAFSDPTCLFRIFNYPPIPADAGPDFQEFGVQEHTDYGYVTLLKQDNSGGLQVKTLDGKWIEAPPVPGTLVINLGDALEHNTGGLVRATPHRVKNSQKSDRISFPFFFDPNFDAKMMNVESLLSPDKQERARAARAAQHQRWDGQRPELFEGTYGEYLLAKVGKVFPDLKDQHLE